MFDYTDPTLFNRHFSMAATAKEPARVSRWTWPLRQARKQMPNPGTLYVHNPARVERMRTVLCVLVIAASVALLGIVALATASGVRP